MYIKKLNKLKIPFFLAALIISGLPYLIASAKQEEPEYTPLTFKSQVGIPFSDIFSGADTAVGQYIASTGEMVSSLLPNYIKAVYDYGIAVVGILAAIILMGGGLLWLTSTGNESRISKAKELIAGGLSGLVLLLSSWLLLNTINPSLLEFKPIVTQIVKKEVFDGDDGFIDDIKNLPADSEIKWVCMNVAYQTCSDTNPITMQLGFPICEKLASNNPKPTNCPFGALNCCGKSVTETNKYKDVCKGKDDYKECKVNSSTNGMCLSEKCIPNSKNVCCEIYSGCVFGLCAYKTCTNDISLFDCSNNANYTSFEGGSSKYNCGQTAWSSCEKK